MNADVYETKNPRKFLIIPTGGTVEKDVPEEVLKGLGKLRKYKIINLNTKSMVGANPTAIEAELKKQGYSIREIEIQITVK